MEPVTILGLIAACCTTISFVPQAIKVIRSKQTQAISLVMYILLNIGVALWTTYGILLGDWPIMLANGITLIFTMSILLMKLRYK